MKSFKKLVCGVLCVSLVLVFTACGGNTEKPATLADQTETEVVTTESVTETETETETQTEVSDDERYLQNLADALEARWKTKPSGNRSAEELGLDEFKAYLHECINAEKAVLQPCDSFNFSDEGLAALAKQYEDALLGQEERVDTIMDMYLPPADYSYMIAKRYVTLEQLVNDYNLPIDTNGSNWKDVTSELSAQHKEVAIYEWMQSLELEWEVDSDNSYSDWTQYKATIENTSGYDIDSIEIEIDLYDEDDVVISQEYDYLDSVKNGQKYHVTFGTDKEYERLEVQYTCYY